jgi:hypothetical protein
MDQKTGAAHSGGSCQVSLSYDQGTSWVVVKSFEGNCPRVRVPGALTNNYDLNQDYNFTIPTDFPSGDRVIFAWTWFNDSGNREMYMSCSPVTIQGSNITINKTPKGPPLFIANLQFNKQVAAVDDVFYKQCHVPDDTSIIFPASTNHTQLDRAPISRNLRLLNLTLEICSSANLTTVNSLKNPQSMLRKY